MFAMQNLVVRSLAQVRISSHILLHGYTKELERQVRKDEKGERERERCESNFSGILSVQKCFRFHPHEHGNHQNANIGLSNSQCNAVELNVRWRPSGRVV